MGAFGAPVILAAETVVALQFFLMDAARNDRDAVGRETELARALLASAAALDYVLLVASQNGDAPLDGDSPAGASLRETMDRAAHAALDYVEVVLSERCAAYDGFVERHVRPGGIVDAIKSLQERGVVSREDLSFRTLVITSDAIERRLGR